MPNRIIKDSICTSEKVSQMTDFQFRLWIGLITQADDAGRGDARPAVIKGRIFPLRDQVTVKQIDNALHELATIGSVILYEVGGKPYYAHKHWSDHQRIRDVKPKYPAPEDGVCQSAADCGELPQTAANCGLNPIQYNPIQSESEYNPNPNNAQGALGDMSDVLREAVSEWLDYKTQKRQGYKPAGLNALIKQVKSSAAQYGDEAVADTIRQSMSNGYQGIVWDKIKRKEAGNATGNKRDYTAEYNFRYD